MKDFTISTTILETAAEAVAKLEEAKNVEFEAKSVDVIEQVGEYLFKFYNTNTTPFVQHFLPKRMGFEVSPGMPSGHVQVRWYNDFVSIWIAADGGSLMYYVYNDKVEIDVSDSQREKASLFLAYHWNDIKRHLDIWAEKDIKNMNEKLKSKVEEIEHKEWIYNNFVL